MNVAVSAKTMPALAPYAAARKEREPCPRADERNDDRGARGGQKQDPVLEVRLSGAAARVAEPEENAESDRGADRADPLAPAEALMEPDPEDQNEKDDLGDHDRLNRGEVPEGERDRLEQETRRREG